MENTEWVILDTETTGFSAPIFVVEIAAQKMMGFEPTCHPFRISRRSALRHNLPIVINNTDRNFFK